MFVVGGLGFALVALVIFALFMSEYSKSAAAKAKEREKLKKDIEDALARKDLPTIKRIRLMNESALEDIDKGLGARLDDFSDDITIERDDESKFRNVGKKA